MLEGFTQKIRTAEISLLFAIGFASMHGDSVTERFVRLARAYKVRQHPSWKFHVSVQGPKGPRKALASQCMLKAGCSFLSDRCVC